MRKFIYHVAVWATAIGIPLFALLTIAEIWRGDWFRFTFLPIPVACVCCLVVWRKLTRGAERST